MMQEKNTVKYFQSMFFFFFHFWRYTFFCSFVYIMSTSNSDIWNEYFTRGDVKIAAQI